MNKYQKVSMTRKYNTVMYAPLKATPVTATSELVGVANSGKQECGLE